MRIPVISCFGYANSLGPCSLFTLASHREHKCIFFVYLRKFGTLLCRLTSKLVPAPPRTASKLLNEIMDTLVFAYDSTLKVDRPKVIKLENTVACEHIKLAIFTVNCAGVIFNVILESDIFVPRKSFFFLFSSYSLYYAEACNELEGPISRHCTQATQFLWKKVLSRSGGEQLATLCPI